MSTLLAAFLACCRLPIRPNARAHLDNSDMQITKTNNGAHLKNVVFQMRTGKNKPHEIYVPDCT
jgi:hypothetical protein